MLVRELRHKPSPWKEYRQTVRWSIAVPLHAVEWVFDWTAYACSRWAFLEVLEYLGVMSILFGVFFYWSEAGDRKKQKHYQAWQVINTAQGKGGNGGRIEALQELNSDGEPLVGVDVSGAFLQGIRIPHASLARATFEAVDARDSVLDHSDLTFADLKNANFRHANLHAAGFQNADLEDVDFVGASLAEANLTGANLRNADLRNCDIRAIVWQSIQSIESANIFGVRNAPAGFEEWAKQHGAVSTKLDDE
jgi:hypothetical protein